MSEGPKQGLGGVFKAEALSIGLGRSSESIEKKKRVEQELKLSLVDSKMIPLIRRNLLVNREK
jgi:hypothetical protein